jgi:tetratricopeptide (TPR) repeat protein
MRVQLSRSEIDNGQLPPLCVCCGRPAEVFKDRVFTWHPAWVYSFLLLLVLPYFVVRWLTAQRRVVRVPLCRRHRYHWAWRHLFFWGGGFLGVCLIGIGCQLEARRGSGRGAEFILAGCLLFLLLPWVYQVFRRSLIRAKRITADYLTLDGVSAKFIMALQQERVSRGEKPATQRCAKCGLESPLLTTFQQRGRRSYCPRCSERRNLTYLKRVVVVELGVGVAGLALVLAGSLAPEDWDWELQSAGWWLLNLFLLLVFEILLIPAHEAGHALTAWLVGARVFTVFVGIGRTIAERRIGKVNFEVKPIPLGGGTVVGHPNIHHYRLKHFLVVLAGPLVNAAFIGILWACVPPGSWEDVDLGEELAPAYTFYLANLVLLGVNLFPMRVQRAGNWISSDGLALCKLLFASAAEVRQAQALYFALEGEECRKAKQYDQAAAWYERGLECYPEDLVNRVNLGVVLMRGRQFGRAREGWLLLLKRTDLDPQVRAIVLNNLAVVDLWVDRSEPSGEDRADDLLEEANRFSAEVLQSVPWLTHAKGTRGMVLVELGRLDEGMALLQQALQDHQDIEAKATCACFLALGKIRQGCVQEARTYLETARQLDPDCDALEKVLKELAGAHPVPEVKTS